MFEGIFKRKKMGIGSPEAPNTTYHSDQPDPAKETGEYRSEQTLDAERNASTLQTGGEKVGMRRDVVEEVGWERELDLRQPSDNSWKSHRDTPYRPEA